MTNLERLPFMEEKMLKSEEAMVTAKPDMIALLDTARDLLEEISPELGGTDPVSGPVVHES